MSNPRYCGGCANAKPVPGNIMQRVCFGGPPQLIATNQGLQTFRPNVAINDPACGQFEALAPAEPANDAGPSSPWQPGQHRPVKLTDSVEDVVYGARDRVEIEPQYGPQDEPEA